MATLPTTLQLGDVFTIAGLFELRPWAKWAYSSKHTRWMWKMLDRLPDTWTHTTVLKQFGVISNCDSYLDLVASEYFTLPPMSPILREYTAKTEMRTGKI